MSDKVESNNPNQEVHVYDGIEEHDNFLPRWWLGILYGTIVFAIGYFTYYVMGPGPTLEQEYQAEAKKIEETLASQPVTGSQMGDEQFASFVKVPANREKGAQVYQGKCLACHGDKGQGGIGPNLTDDYWIHGAKPSQLVTVITNGVGDKGMPPWGPLLKPEEIHSLVAFIFSLRGTNPPNSKAPQGELVKAL
jgi:cytochrome c oxidase cbb3-type subunit 3